MKKIFKSKEKIHCVRWSDSGNEPVLNDDSVIDVDYESTECMFCKGLYSEDAKGEQWMRCKKYLKWSHEECYKLDKKKNYLWICWIFTWIIWSLLDLVFSLHRKTMTIILVWTNSCFITTHGKEVAQNRIFMFYLFC